jgi:RHS repeat-associated protein
LTYIDFFREILRKDPSGKAISKGPDIFRYKFTGQEEDAETGLLYFNAKYYDPEIGRFISADTMVPDPENSQSFNKYMYVRGNPLRYIDPTGNTDEGAYQSGGYYDNYSIQLFSMFNSIDFYSMPMMGNDFVMPGFSGVGGLDALNTISSDMSWFSALSMMDSGMSMG